MDVHKKHLENIRNTKSRFIDCSTPESFRIKKPKRSNVLTNNRNHDIYHENKILLEKLLVLSDEKMKLSRMRSQDPSGFRLKSIRNVNRKKHEERLVRENKDLADRLASMSPSVSAVQLEKDYWQHVKYKLSMSKYESTRASVKKNRIVSISRTQSKGVLPPVNSKGDIYRMYMGEYQELSGKKEWKIASFEPQNSTSNLMAIPIAI
ncbi:hypothetical protein SteCoe_4038 [Stentor coeruleus]|uniref:Uncharacterized protein n=1 Tax=Stentor coeruleus TaxID=5963 RepID=A0A1R2CVR0_9CILI|nr:hypothetical protein SteCoe_4038 [Stentor coeruleus]